MCEKINKTDKKAEKLARLQAVATSRGGKCLSTEYLGVVVKHRWECSEGHQWASTPDSVVNRGTWCPVCARNALGPNGLSRLQQVAEERGGKCLAPEYLGVNNKHLWECSEGHQWEARVDNVVHNGAWCPVCAKKRRDYEMSRLQQVAAERGGKCLSPGYRGSKVKHHWECSRGHQWVSTPDSVVNRGTWCLACEGNARLQQAAAERGGKCLSPEYLGTAKNHRWECSEGHQWEAMPDSVVRQGTWCPVCERNARLQQAAAERGGKCLSPEYLGTAKNHRWECSKGHQWEATPNSVVRKGTWCPVCAKNKRKTARP